MKTILLALAAFAVFHSGVAENYETYGRALMQKMRSREEMETYLEKFEQFCPGESDNLSDALVEIETCLAPKLSQKTICGVFRDNLAECMRPVVSILRRCFPTNAKDLPQLVFDSMLGGVKYICKTDGEHIFELSNQCVTNRYQLGSCQRRFRSKLQQFQREPPSKTDVCETFTSLKPCLVKHIESSCTNSITREASIALLDAMLEPCWRNTRRVNEVDSDDVESDVELMT